MRKMAFFTTVLFFLSLVILAGPSRAAPQVVSVNISDTLITESDDGGTLTITITYNEDMDTSVDPDIAFDPDIVVSGTLTFNSGAWTSSRTYEANYTIADVDEEVSGVDVIVENARNLGGEKQDPYTEPDAIDVDTYIGIPTLIYPINGENTNDNTPILHWQSLIDGSPPVWYYVSVSDNATFPYENFSSGWITDNNWTTPNLSDGIWYWRVKARDNAGNEGGWSSVWSFRVDTIPPAAPTLVSPSDGENTNDNTPTLVWNNIFENSLPVVYTIEVDTENTFTDPLFFTTTVENWSTTGTSSITTPVLPSIVYYWRVRARDNAGNEGEWSDVWSFRVDTIAPTVSGISTVPDNVISESDDGTNFTILIQFSEYMDTSVHPDIAFDPDIISSGTLTFISGTWNSNILYEANYIVSDEDEEAYVYAIVENARDLVGNAQVPFRTSHHLIYVDTVAPQVIDINVSDNLITESDSGGTLTITITFSEDMDTLVAPDIAFDPDIVSSGTLTFNSGMWTSSTTYVATYDIADVDEEVPDVDIIVENARDLAGNIQIPYTEFDAIDVDTVAPWVTGIIM
ncbi:MAG: hypothetical protein QW704_02445, partial [Candidatus Hadarchaeales archaeon]